MLVCLRLSGGLQLLSPPITTSLYLQDLAEEGKLTSKFLNKINTKNTSTPRKFAAFMRDNLHLLNEPSPIPNPAPVANVSPQCLYKYPFHKLQAHPPQTNPQSQYPNQTPKH